MWSPGKINKNHYKNWPVYLHIYHNVIHLRQFWQWVVFSGAQEGKQSTKKSIFGPCLTFWPPGLHQKLIQKFYTHNLSISMPNLLMIQRNLLNWLPAELSQIWIIMIYQQETVLVTLSIHDKFFCSSQGRKSFPLCPGTNVQIKFTRSILDC